jgi:hypothetical protein
LPLPVRFVVSSMAVRVARILLLLVKARCSTRVRTLR